MTGGTPREARGFRTSARVGRTFPWVVVAAVAVALLAALPAIPSVGAPSTNLHGPTGVHGGTAAPAASNVPCSSPRASSCAGLVPPKSLFAGAANSAYQTNHTMGWSEVAALSTGPGFGAGILADSASSRGLLFGGESSGRLVNSTFSYSVATNTWSPVVTANAPAPRSDFGFGLDTAADVGVLFGGLTNLSRLAVSNQTYSYNLATAQWTPRTAGTAPPAREAPAFAVSSSLGVALLYGGWNRNYSGTESITFSDLWELNLTTYTWSQLAPSGSRPPPLEGATMLWDPATLRFEMFGGCYPCTSAVWQFDPATLRWAELATSSTSPVARDAASWAYDPTLTADLLYGGANGGVSFNDTYIFYPVTDTWVVQTSAARPAARSEAAGGFLDVPGNESLLLAGGVAGSVAYSDVWRLSATSNVSIEVRNASSLAPLVAAHVNLSGFPVGNTSGTGQLNLTQVDGVGEPFVVSEFRYFTENTVLWLPPGRVSNLTVDLVPEPSGTVTVTVLHASGRAYPQVGVNLTVNGTRVDVAPAITDANGNATFYGVPPGRTNATATARFQRPNSTVGLLPEGGTLNLTTRLVPDPFLTATVLGRFPGRAPFPLNFVPVLLNGQTIGFTDSAGEVSEFVTAFGLSELGSESGGYATGTTLVSIPWTGTVNASLILSSLPFAEVAITVLRRDTGLPIAGASVAASTTTPLPSGPYSVVNSTNSAGTVTLSLPQGQFGISVSANGFYPSNSTYIFVLTGSTQSLLFYLEPIPPATVYFLVLDAKTGHPISGANVTLAAGLGGRTNASGKYNTTVPAQTYIVLVTDPLYITNSTVLTLLPGENVSRTVNLTLAPPALTVGAWAFNLFPGSLTDLWPFLFLPFLLILGAYVYATALRASNRDEDPLALAKVAGPKPTVPPAPADPAPGSASRKTPP